ncbi:zinc ribbon domain-containing protein [Haloarcula sp. H-GB4]|uniref:zinc ribbon domain-containing protein n=1 Tax=Haloarcula sp. H-GB4 TaxID=3069755 RepID=UPI0027B42882|nr:zinc ribbon domain-containing protein [Haloarcula sp. H-GB4]MDQ2072824.1 zinc ribbon domain-containing protein [Haloarcula sp. H-GB4]
MSSHSAAATTAPSLEPDAVTPIGIDLGEKRLVAAAPADADPEDAFIVDGEPLRERLNTLVETIRMLQAAEFDTTTGEAQAFAALYAPVKALLCDAAAQVVRYAGEFATPLLVLEDLNYPGESLWERRTAGEMGAWLLPALQKAITEVALDTGLPVSYVDPKYTSQACHVCEQLCHLRDEVAVCTTDDCPVERVCRDCNAAVNIANRAIR